MSAAGRDIGSIPDIVDPQRRERCKQSLLFHLLTYHFPAFPIKFSPSHIDLIRSVERAILRGEFKVTAMPRGGGKTAILLRSILWGILHGHVKMGVLVGATDPKARDNLAAINSELEANDILADDFPESVFPIRCLERSTKRCKGQTHLGIPTRLEFTKDRIVFPTIPGSPASGSVLISAGLTGAGIRGSSHTTADGVVLRPEVALCDDPQTRKSAASPVDNRTRERIITSDIVGLAGPGRSTAVLVAITVIYKGDLADRLLDSKLHPRWQGSKVKLLESMPSNMESWDKYSLVRDQEFRNGGDGSLANQRYLDNREEMDKGAEPSWIYRKLQDDISAIQFAMNVYYDTPDAFHSEFQNEPKHDHLVSGDILEPAQIANRLSSVPHKIVPTESDLITSFIDVHDNLLYWAVCGWTRGFRGYVLDYGSWPEQPVPYYSLGKAKVTLPEKYKTKSKEGAILNGLIELVKLLLSRDWEREEGEDTLRISRLNIDAGYKPKIVEKMCRHPEYGRLLGSSRGYSLPTPVNDWKRRPGEKEGDNWRDSYDSTVKGRRTAFDANAWKTFLHNRLAAGEGDPTSLTLYGTKASVHEMLADHIAAEYKTEKTIQGRTFEAWQIKPGRPDNHLLDCLVGCAVTASIMGAKIPDLRPTINATKDPQNQDSTKQPRKRKKRKQGIRYAS